MDENKKLNILKDRKLDRQEKNIKEGLFMGIKEYHTKELNQVLIVGIL